MAYEEIVTPIGHTSVKAKFYNVGRILAITAFVLSMCVALFTYYIHLKLNYEMVGIYLACSVISLILQIAAGVCIAIGSKSFRAFGIMVALCGAMSTGYFMALTVLVAVSLYSALRNTQYERLAYVAVMLWLVKTGIGLFTGIAGGSLSGSAGLALSFILCLPGFAATCIMVHLLYKIGNARAIEAREQAGELIETPSAFFGGRIMLGTVIVVVLLIAPYVLNA